uniref:Keratin, type I cytoskeletal 20-like n=1 Tax=Neolamprologus brichardi TaxID=32507 RepID=A0A3Q4GGM5_NEOBR
AHIHSSYSVKQRTYSSSSLGGWKQSARSSVGYTPSVHGGAGGYGTRISRSNSVFSLGSVGSYGETSVVGDGKATMQDLNDRLADYLAKVRSLEAKNRQLELNIAEFCQQKSTVVTKNYGGYYSTISDLRAEIARRFAENQAIHVQLDNAQLAAEDFKMKYDMEMNLHLTVEADVSRLRAVRDSLTLGISDLELSIEDLNTELAQMRANHKEEMSQLSIQCSGSVNVEVDSAHSIDLTKVLEEMREQYETVVSKNKLEVEKWFQSKVEILQKEIIVSQTDVKTFHKELSVLKKTYQSLMISRQILDMKENLEEVKSRYSLQLQQLQVTISTLEIELQELKASLLRVQTEYNELLDIKMRLEMEIRKPHIEKRVKTIIEEIVDGQVVASSEATQVETVQ